MLFFETYAIIALVFAIITICIAGLYLKSKKYTFGFSALMVGLGVVIPNFLILFQKGFGSYAEIDSLNLRIFRIQEGIVDILRHTIIETKPLYQQAFDYFTDNIGFIILSIVIGIASGILIHLMLKKQRSATLKS